jgi:hypothetical protein
MRAIDAIAGCTPGANGLLGKSLCSTQPVIGHKDAGLKNQCGAVGQPYPLGGHW